MMRRLTLAVIVFAGAANAEKRVITHDDVWLMKRVGEPVASPDGKFIVFNVVEPAYDPAKQVSDLWLVPADGSTPARRLTNTRAAEATPVWSPDSKSIAFSTRREGDEVAQVYELSLTGGEAERVTSLSTGATNPRFRPDGKAILFESSVYPGARDDAENQKIAADRKARKYNARVYDTFPIRFWNIWLDDRRPHIYVQQLERDAKARDLLAGTRLDASAGFAGLMNGLSAEQSLQPVWAPDGGSVVFVAIVNREVTMSAETESHLFRVPAAGGEPQHLAPPGQSFSRPSLSPRGDALYAQHQRMPAGGRLYSLTRLARFAWPPAAIPAAPHIVTDGFDRSIAAFAVASDGRVFLEAEDEGHDKLYRLASGGKVEPLFDVKEGGYTNPVVAGDLVIARYSSRVLPSEIVIASGARSVPAFLTDFNKERAAEIDWTLPQHFWFTARNGKRIHNLLTLPPTFDPAHKYPLVAFPHGGPASMSKDSFSPRWDTHYLASPGYVILETNYTGSTGFGEKFADDIERDVLRGPAEEILEAIQEAIRRYPFIDGSRQAAIGASYGGYLMNWFNGHTDQFRCLINHAGAINNESQYGVNDGGYGRELRMGGPIWEKGGQWNDQSPIRYAKNFHTPMLITQGEQDFRVPMSESITTFKLLQRLKVPCRLLVFPEAAHWVLRGEDNRFHMQEVLAWLKTYLDPAQPVWPPPKSSAERTR
jgi:dipeptidyl aminopeptidase/acylaminoacyl peptidase